MNGAPIDPRGEFGDGLELAVAQAVRFITFLALTGCVLGCGAQSQPDAGTPDQGELPDVGADAGQIDTGPNCAIDVQATAEASEGGLFRLSVDEPDLVEVTWPLGWSERPAQDGAMVARLPYGASGAQTLRLQKRCSQGVAEAAVEVDVRPIRFASLPTWTQGNGPEAREHAQVWIDPQDENRMLLFGGFGFSPRQFTVIADMWAYDLLSNTWTEVSATDAPMRAAGRIALLPDQRELLYFGGDPPSFRSAFGLSRMRWEGQTAVWSEIDVPEPRPDGSSLGSFIHDRPRDRFLSVCGFGNSIQCDVWSYIMSENTITQLPVTPGPNPRYGFFAVHDEPGERLVVYAGAQNPVAGDQVNAASDTWALDLSEDTPQWSVLLDENASPPGRRNGCSALDPQGRRFFVWGGTADGRTVQPGLWVLDLEPGFEGWQEVPLSSAPPDRTSCSAVYDPARRRILFGFGVSMIAPYADLLALEL